MGNMGKWIASGDTCPECGDETEMYIVEEDGYEIEVKERCKNCKWTIRFDNDERESY
jgi:Zn ribbon nucleic-acid-binding protein